MQGHYTSFANIPQTSGIYRITCTSINKFYIGSAVNLRKRWLRHLNELSRNIHYNAKMQRAFNKYGEASFIVEVVELVLIPEMLTVREQYWLDKLKPFFNIAPIAGSLLGMPSPRIGIPHTEETRKKMSQSQTGRTHAPETKEKIRVGRVGKKWNEEAHAKASAAHMGKRGTFLGKKHSAESKEKMLLAHFDERKTLIVTAPNGSEHTIQGIRQFCKMHNLDHSALKKVADGKQSSHKGWKARYPD